MRYWTLLILILGFNTCLFAQNETNYTITDLTGQYNFPVFGMVRYGDTWYVTSPNKKVKTGKTHTDIFITDPKVGKLVPFATNIMSGLDDGIPTFTDNGSTMYYTSVYNVFSGEGKTLAKKLKIESATYDGSDWKPANKFPYNSPDYRTAHPTINSNGRILVFVSDMPRGKGGMDLYMCVKEGDTWTQPQNLVKLNSTGNELFPVFDKNGGLVFSSNGLGGSGGLDLFTAKYNGTDFDGAVNMPTPFNSKFDDFFLFSEDDMKTGYLSTNRFGDAKSDHVAYFEPATKNTAAAQTGIVVYVLDKYTRTPLPYATVSIKDKSGQLFHQGLTDPNGSVTLDELPKDDYTIQGMLNEVSTTIAKVTEADFKTGAALVKEVLHNDPRFTLAGLTINNHTKQPISGVVINCLNTNTAVSKKMSTGADGTFLFQLEQNSDFEVQAEKTGWLSSEVAEKTTRGLDRTQQLYVNLELMVEQPVSKGTVTLRKIHYDYNKCDIRQDAATELNRLVALLNDYPDMVIELSSHTDSRGSDSYNLSLSQCRADAAVNYLCKKGIKRARMHAKGYGETKLLNRCGNDINCTDTEHAENRRTEFTILSCPTCPGSK